MTKEEEYIEKLENNKMLLQKAIAPNSIEWGSAAKGNKHKIYYEDEQDGKDRLQTAKLLEEEKEKLFNSGGE